MVEVMGGPQDGAQALVDARVGLPDSISFPAEPDGTKRHIYRLVEKSERFSAYTYDHVEVSA